MSTTRDVPYRGSVAGKVGKTTLFGAGSLLEIERGACLCRWASKEATAVCGSGVSVSRSGSASSVLLLAVPGSVTTTASETGAEPVPSSTSATGAASDNRSAGQSRSGSANTSSLSASVSGVAESRRAVFSRRRKLMRSVPTAAAAVSRGKWRTTSRTHVARNLSSSTLNERFRFNRFVISPTSLSAPPSSNSSGSRFCATSHTLRASAAATGMAGAAPSATRCGTATHTTPFTSRVTSRALTRATSANAGLSRRRQ